MVLGALVMLIRERPRVIITGQPCGAERPYSPGRLSSHMGHTAAVPLTPPLAGFLLPTLNYCTWRGVDFREGVALVVCSGDEQRYTDGGQHCGLPGHDLCWRKGELGPRGVAVSKPVQPLSPWSLEASLPK